MFLPSIPEGNMLIFYFYTLYCKDEKLKYHTKLYYGKVELIRILL